MCWSNQELATDRNLNISYHKLSTQFLVYSSCLVISYLVFCILYTSCWCVIHHHHHDHRHHHHNNNNNNTIITPAHFFLGLLWVEELHPPPDTHTHAHTHTHTHTHYTIIYIPHLASYMHTVKTQKGCFSNFLGYCKWLSFLYANSKKNVLVKHFVGG